jgi:hypothetical protein
MNKTIFAVAMLMLGTSASFSQETKTDKPKESTPAKLVVPTRVAVKGARTAPQTPPAAPPASNTIYYLTSAKVTVVTGNDAKELPSAARFYLDRIVGNIPASVTYEVGLYVYMKDNHPLEFKANSTNEIELDPGLQLPGQYEGWRYASLGLGVIQDAGLQLTVQYLPNFILDAWKIDKITLTLEFKDLAGNPHPSMGRVVIPFQNVSKILNKQNSMLTLQTDKFLLPKN